MDLLWNPKKHIQSYRVSGQWHNDSFLGKAGLEVNDRTVLLSLMPTIRLHTSTVLGISGAFDILKRSFSTYDCGLMCRLCPGIRCMLGYASLEEKEFKQGDLLFRTHMNLSKRVQVATETVGHMESRHISTTLGVRLALADSITAKLKVSSYTS